ncbi:hypothetical protein IGI04_009996 [Brassica rapa subsp. trilocularis]|uniref:FBD domain-containing protein n=1 Tax=Brassica rapa subsp. trilocularis TaxID=1813537 RepID=A0ABQ7MYX2_BRACM|nr:hypothetical protein IGI04_009996 [Brassica rapa subsp. trilocularis]
MVGRKRKTKTCDKGSKRSWICQLPDVLISGILARVPTKIAVRTGVLSKTWINHWKNVRGLDLESFEFSDMDTFVSFVRSFFDSHRESTIDKIRLSVHYSDCHSLLTQWTDIAIRRRIQHLDVCYYGTCCDVTMPVSLYTCKTLVHLRLCWVVLANLEIDAPLLECLRTTAYLEKNFMIINLGCSTTLDIDMVFPDVTCTKLLICDTLTDIPRFRGLVTSSYILKNIFLHSEPGPLLQFRDLSRLHVKFSKSDLEMLPAILESCPKLQSLILELIKDPSYKKNREPKLMFSTVPPCLVSSLKVVELKRLIPRYEGEVELVRYFLKNSPILEKLRLDTYYTKKGMRDFLKEVVALPRCSSACEPSSVCESPERSCRRVRIQTRRSDYDFLAVPMVGRKRKAKTCDKGSQRSWICQLPDDLISDILLRVPTKHAVRTGVLSKTWINHWKSVRGLDLESFEFLDMDTFVSFVRSFFDSHRESMIDKIRLSVHYSDCKSLLTKWTDISIRRSVQHLDVCYYGPYSCDVTMPVKVVINAPLLECLKTRGYVSKNFKIINLGCSTTLEIYAVFPRLTCTKRFICDTLTDIPRFRGIVISSYILKNIFLHSEPGPLLQFRDLSRLHVKFSKSDLEMLPSILENCPKLQSLILELIKDPSYKKNREPKLMFSTVPPCLVSSLKVVELIRLIPKYEGEVELVRYFLKNSPILEKLRLDTYYTKKGMRDFLKEVVALPRCSSACEVIVL